MAALYSDPVHLEVLLRGLKFAEADIDRMFSITALAGLRFVEADSAPITAPPCRRSRRRPTADDGPPWITCPGCGVLYQRGGSGPAFACDHDWVALAAVYPRGAHVVVRRSVAHPRRPRRGRVMLVDGHWRWVWLDSLTTSSKLQAEQERRRSGD